MPKPIVVCAIGSGLAVSVLSALFFVAIAIAGAFTVGILIALGMPEPSDPPKWLRWVLLTIGIVTLPGPIVWMVDRYQKFYRRCRGLPAKANGEL